MTTARNSSLAKTQSALQEADSEEEVRLTILDQLGIAKKLKVIGNTDGIWSDRLFEFKHDKRFNTKGKWRKSGFGVLAQGIYYCRKILNFEIPKVSKLPHTMIFCDKNGGFILPSKTYEWILHFDPFDYSSGPDQNHESIYNKYYDYLVDNDFTWDMPPSSQNPALVKVLMDIEALKEAIYFDFSKDGQLESFIDSVKSSKGEIPTISITNNNFIGIFDSWLKAFAPSGARRRDWVDRYILDLRRKFKLDDNAGQLSYKDDSFRVSSSKYKAFWKLYKRPPASAVDEFINTNKDLLYDVTDQNNHGDFYTPLRLVGLAQSTIARHLEKNKKRTWWDPAAGGGNLFFRFSRPHRSILTTMFKEDCDGLRGNPSVKSDIIEQVDFINDLIGKDLLHQKLWKKISGIINESNELVFFLNPPFDDQAESGGTNKSVPENFLDNEDSDKVSKRSLRALHTRFLYRILSIARTLNKPVWVATFSKVGWVVGPDSTSFYKVWSKNFDFVDGFIVSSKVFNGIKQEWPCLFSVWQFNPKESTSETHLDLPVFNSKYEWIGIKTLNAFDSTKIRMSSSAKLDKKVLGSRNDYVVVPPLKNEYEVAETVYEDKLPANALGYLRIVANDVYNSQKRVVYLSSMFGPSNHNGTPILKENFESAMMIYGVRKCIRRTWLNDKDEFYLPKTLTKGHRNLIRKSIVYSLVDGGYASSIKDLEYEGEYHSFRNEFSIPSTLELRRWGAKDLPDKNSYAYDWIRKAKGDFSTVEANAIAAAKSLIKESLKAGARGNGDPERQLDRGDAGIRQLINGLLDFEGAVVGKALKKAYDDYLKCKEVLRTDIEQDVYSLGILDEFTEARADEQILLNNLDRLEEVVSNKAKSVSKKSTKKKKTKKRN